MAGMDDFDFLFNLDGPKEEEPIKENLDAVDNAVQEHLSSPFDEEAEEESVEERIAEYDEKAADFEDSTGIEGAAGAIAMQNDDIEAFDAIVERELKSVERKGNSFINTVENKYDMAIDQINAELLELHEIEEKDREVEKEIRAKITAARNLINQLEQELDSHREKTYTHRQLMRETEAKLTEAEHDKLEAERQAEIDSRRNKAMAGFKHHIDELNPEWKDYAFDHQWEGASTLALYESGLLADDMGMGKSLEAIMYADMVKAKRILVVTPSDTCTNFTIEWGMWAKHRFVFTLANQDKFNRDMFWNVLIQPRLDKDEDITLTINYEQLYSDMDFFDRLVGAKFDTIIVDEAHNFKNKKSVLFERLKVLRINAERILPMTGTFILNKPQDIWPALHLVDKEAFPSERDFLDAYCSWNYYESAWEFREGGEKSMLTRLGGRIVKRTMEEAGIILPKMTIHDENCECGCLTTLAFQNDYNDQRKIIRQLAEHSQLVLDSERKTSVIEQIALITRQRQAIAWPAGITIKNEDGSIAFSVGEEIQESIKMDWVESKVRDVISQGKRIAVFSQFKTVLAELDKRLSDLKVVRYDGDTDKETKIKVKQDFDRRHVDKNNGEYLWDIVLCNFKTGGVGLNFTHVTDMVVFDEEWNPGKNQQAYKRIQRIGQTEETHVWIPRVKRSIDTWMKNLNDRKANLIAGFNEEVDLTKEFSNFLNVVKDT